MKYNPGQAEMIQVQKALATAKDLTCTKCGNNIFMQSYIIKQISAILSPTGKEILYPMQVFSCTQCGNIDDMFTGENSDTKSEESAPETPKSNLIL